ncbi:MAG: ABC transporter ATP-binding protein [Dehalococcoidia bacterium]
MLLEVRNATVHYGRAIAVDEVSMNVAEGEIVTVIGANGAGKTTTLRAISGLMRLTSGEIWFRGQRIDKRSPREMIRDGIAFCMEGRRLFPDMTVLENLEVGTFCRQDKKEVGHDLKAVCGQFPILEKRLRQKAGTLSGGEQQMLAIARVIVSKPRLLLLDEPSLGLAPLMVMHIGEIIKQLNEGGMTILMVEQNAQMALGLAHRGYILETGRITTVGDSPALREDGYVRDAYLGV